jgi:hypothetical protein
VVVAAAQGVGDLFGSVAEVGQGPDEKFPGRGLHHAAHDWLTVVQLPAYAPELNPAEGVWSHLKRGLGNLAACGTDELAAIVRTRLKSMQHRPSLLDAFIAETGLALQPQPP